MKERIIMNSDNLQKTFTKEYEKFFLENNLVISVPHIINLGCIYNKELDNQQIRQKIPSKMFLGINILSGSEKVTFKDITYFSSKDEKFITVPYDTIFANIYEDYPQRNMKSLLSILQYNKGIEINILSENERGSGIEFSGLIPVLLAAGMHILTEQITSEELNNKIIFPKSVIFEKIYGTAEELLNISKLDSHGIIARAAMEHNRGPMISFGSIPGKKGQKAKINKIVNMWDFFDIKKNQSQSMIDYGIINFSSGYDEYYINNVYENLKGTHSLKSIAALAEISLDINNKLIKARGGILNTNNSDDKLVDDFINTVGQQGLFEAFIEKEYTLFADIISLFNQTRQFQDEKIGLTTLSSNRNGGSFLFVTKQKKSRETMEKLLTKLKEFGHTTAFYQYLSRTDGFTDDGLQVEQYVDKGYFSSHIQEDDVMLAYGYGSEYGKKTIGNHRKLLEETKESVIFDCIDGKIHLNNEITNHNEILTQSGTVEIIKVLFENMGKYINNSKLPSSSYSKNKNEMTGKIIGPLQGLIEKKYGEKLDLECTGSITDFDLKLTENGINICLLKKIH